MDYDMEQQLQCLRIKNQKLLLDLYQGQENCRDVIRSLQTGPCNNFGSSALKSGITLSSFEKEKGNSSRQINRNVTVVEPQLEGGVSKARCYLRSKQKPLVQGIPTNSANRKVSTDDQCKTEVQHRETPTDNLNSEPMEPIQGTPKSILKRRKIVDDNVKVSSKYEHTPTYKSTSTKTNLNFSYSDVDDLEIAKERYKLNGAAYPENECIKNGDLNGSYIDETSEIVENDNGLGSDTSRYNERVKGYQNHDALDYESETARNIDIIEAMMSDRLLLDSGNDRKNVRIIEALKNRPKSILFDDTEKEKKQENNLALKSRSENLDKSITKEMSQLLDIRDSERPLLGYDWIAGVLDNGPVLTDKPEEYFQSIKDFRRQNKDDCIGSTGLENIIDLTKPIEPEVQNPAHTCIHGFVLNERLFPEAINSDENGKSTCPVCLSTRSEPTQDNPGFIRVSIPRSTLLSPYRVRPHRRRSFDSSDSISLSNHCMAGYECSKPSTLPTASNLDLKHTSSGNKLTQSGSELDRLTQSFNRTSRTLNELQSLSQLNSTTADLHRQMRQTTDDLLNTSHSFRFELQKMEGERKMEKPAPFSTAYPAF